MRDEGWMHWRAPAPSPSPQVATKRARNLGDPMGVQECGLRLLAAANAHSRKPAADRPSSRYAARSYHMHTTGALRRAATRRLGFLLPRGCCMRVGASECGLRLLAAYSVTHRINPTGYVGPMWTAAACCRMLLPREKHNPSPRVAARRHANDDARCAFGPRIERTPVSRKSRFNAPVRGQ